MSKRPRRVLERFPAPPGLAPTMPEYEEAQALRRGLLEAPEIARDRLRRTGSAEMAEMFATLILISDLAADRADPRRGKSFLPLLELRRSVEQHYVATASDALQAVAGAALSPAAQRQLIRDYLSILRFSQADALLQQMEAHFAAAGSPDYWPVAIRATRVMRAGIPEGRLRLGLYDPLAVLP